MEHFEKLSITVIEWLSARGLSSQDVQVLSLGIALVGLLCALIALMRARRSSRGVNGAVAERLERVLVQLGDLSSKLDRAEHRLNEEQVKIRERLAKLERAADLSVPSSAAREAEQKKKLEELTQPASFEDTPQLPELDWQQKPPAIELTNVVPLSDALPVPLEAPPVFELPPQLPAEPEKREPEKPKTSIFSGLKKTRDAFFSRLAGILSTDEITEKTYNELEELLITSDLGVKTTQKLLADLKTAVREGSVRSADSARALLKANISGILRSGDSPEILPEKRGTDPLVILVVGVNGVGKTTTIGKLASRFSARGARVLLGAADTFRAAAAEQIEVWAERAEVQVLRGSDNAKPTTVAYEAIHQARKDGFDVVIIDTAGRLHTRVNLMNELTGVISIIEREQPGAPHETLLVVDATTGQNALEQAKEFHARAKLTGVVVTKLDGTPKGGIVVAIRDELGVPIRYVGVGESAADLKAFSADEFTEALFAEGEEGAFSASQGKGEVRAVRRRRGNGADD